MNINHGINLAIDGGAVAGGQNHNPPVPLALLVPNTEEEQDFAVDFQGNDYMEAQEDNNNSNQGQQLGQGGQNERDAIAMVPPLQQAEIHIVDGVNVAILGDEGQLGEVPDAAAHILVSIAEALQPRMERTPNNTLQNVTREPFCGKRLPSSFETLFLQWRLQGLGEFVSGKVKNHWPTPQKVMFSKWLFLYNHLKRTAGYHIKKEDQRSFPENKSVGAINAKMTEAAEALDLERGDTSMDKSRQQLKAALKEAGRVQGRNHN